MKKSILMISDLSFYSFIIAVQRLALVFCCLCVSVYSNAQLLKFPDIYPKLPFDLFLAKDMGNNKCTVWKGTYTKAADDESGFIWSNAITESHQFQKFIFPDGKMDKISTYNNFGDKLWSIEFFYKQGFLSAVEKLNYDSLQESSLDYAYAYLYRYDSMPFQRVKMFGFPNKSLRLLDEFGFDTLNRLIRIKSTATGSAPFMDSLVGLKNGEQILTLTEFDQKSVAKRVYKNLYVILSDCKSFYNEKGEIGNAEYRNSEGQMLSNVVYDYENGRLSKKSHWKFPVIDKSVPPQEKKKKKKKKKKKSVNLPLVDTEPKTEEIKPEIFKLEFFTYSDDGLLEMHIIEENGIQTVLEYTFFMD